MEKLHNICGLHHLAPTEMQIELPEIPAYAPEYGGGFGDVFKYVYQGRELAVKVLKNHRNDDLQKITRVSSFRAYLNPLLCLGVH